MRKTTYQKILRLQQVAGVSSDAPADLLTVDQRFAVALGQPLPILPDGTRWRMNLHDTVQRVDIIEPSLAALADTMTARFADFAPRLALAELSLQANKAADDLDHALLVQTKTTADAALARTYYLEQLEVANKAVDDAQELRITAAKTEADEDKVAAAQALTAAQNAISVAVAAQASAKVADDKAVAVGASVTTAQALATTTAASLAAYKARTRSGSATLPPTLIGGTATVDIVWAEAFPGVNFDAFPSVVTTSLFGLTGNVFNQTATGCQVKVKNTVGLNILASQATVEVFALYRT